MSDSIDVSPQEINQLFTALKRKVSDMTPILDEIGEAFVSSVQRNFQVGGRFGKANPYGGGTQHWVPSGRAIREAGGTLTDTGQLAASITFRRKGKTGLTVGTNKIYGAVHQYGGRAGRNNSALIPARPFIVLQDDDLQEVIDILKDYLSG